MDQKTKHLKNAQYTYSQFAAFYPKMAARIPGLNGLSMTIPDWMGWAADLRGLTFRLAMRQDFPTPERD